MIRQVRQCFYYVAIALASTFRLFFCIPTSVVASRRFEYRSWFCRGWSGRGYSDLIGLIGDSQTRTAKFDESHDSESADPKLWETLHDYTRQRFFADLIAGVTVGLVALPLAMAFAISSGVPPQAGIYTAIIAGFIVSALGGSRCQIAGPTGAFVVIVAGIVTQFGVSGLLMCTAMAGVILVVMGVTGLGSAVRFIPRSVTIGFTNGIAVLIASTQIKDFFGLSVNPVPSEFLPRMAALCAANTFTGTATLTAVATLAIVLLWPWVTKKVPGSIVALFAITATCALLAIPVETIGSKFGGIPIGLPAISMPEFAPI